MPRRMWRHNYNSPIFGEFFIIKVLLVLSHAIFSLATLAARYHCCHYSDIYVYIGKMEMVRERSESISASFASEMRHKGYR